MVFCLTNVLGRTEGRDAVKNITRGADKRVSDMIQ